MLQTPIRRFCFLVLCTILSLPAFAQVNKTTFLGTIQDEASLPLPGATLMVLHAADSTLVQFGSSNNEGAFTIKNVPKGDYLLNVTFLGMEPVFKPITAGNTEEENLGIIQLLPKSNILKEVNVQADHVPVEIKKDTISYNADAFQTQPNAVVEDLLKKLPGLEVGSDGSIKAQGEEVQNVFVDGKEFFGNDPKMATKNLPAKAVKKVNVYDKKSDMSEFTGIDDGERSKTIDLVLREEFKKGLFGTAEAGYGTDERYNAKASINRFTKTSQLSFLGQLNNINDQGFSFTDIVNFSGGMRGLSGGGGRRTLFTNLPFNEGTTNGLVNTAAGGLNFNWQKSDKFNLRSSYFINNVDKYLLENSYRQNISANPFDTDEDSQNDTRNLSHNITLNSDIKPDSFNQVKANLNLNFNNGDGLNTLFQQNITPDSLVTSQSTNTTSNNADNISVNGGATYIRRLGNRGRNFSLGGTITAGDQDSDTKLDALTEYFNTGNQDLLDQLQYTTSNNLTLGGTFSYTEPLKKRRFLEFNYDISHQDNDYEQLVNDIENSVEIPNDTLSNQYSSTFVYHRPGVTFQYSGEVNTINAGIQYQASELRGDLSRQEADIKQTYNHLLPSFSWRSNMGNGKYLRVNYNTRINAPSITQLSPVIDNSNPLQLYIGNPGLDAEYNHSLRVGYHSFSQFSSTSFFASITGNITNNKIITSRFFNEDFREVSTPINIDDESGVSLYASFGRPFKPIRSRVNLSGNIGLTKTQNVVGTDLLNTNRWNQMVGITITNMNSEVLEYRIGGEWTITNNLYKSEEALDQNTLLQNYFAEFTLTIWKKWTLTASYDYRAYSSDQFSENQVLPLMKASISRFILKDDKGQLKFSVFDVLDENKGVSITANPNYLERITSNSIGQYAMFSFIYSIRGAGSTPPGGGFQYRRHP